MLFTIICDIISQEFHLPEVLSGDIINHLIVTFFIFCPMLLRIRCDRIHREAN